MTSPAELVEFAAWLEGKAKYTTDFLAAGEEMELAWVAEARADPAYAAAIAEAVAAAAAAAAEAAAAGQPAGEPEQPAALPPTAEEAIAERAAAYAAAVAEHAAARDGLLAQAAAYRAAAVAGAAAQAALAPGAAAAAQARAAAAAEREAAALAAAAAAAQDKAAALAEQAAAAARAASAEAREVAQGGAAAAAALERAEAEAEAALLYQAAAAAGAGPGAAAQREAALAALPADTEAKRCALRLILARMKTHPPYIDPSSYASVAEDNIDSLQSSAAPCGAVFFLTALDGNERVLFCANVRAGAAFSVPRPFDAYAVEHWGVLGAPKGEAFSRSNGKQQDFELGSCFYQPRRGVFHAAAADAEAAWPAGQGCADFAAYARSDWGTANN